MRTTLDIDIDVLQTAKDLARKEGKTAGAVISELARRGFYAAAGEVTESVQPYQIRDGVPVLKPTGALVSDDHVRSLRDELGI